MRLLSSFIAFALLSVIVDASSLHDGYHRAANHNKLARRGNGRCKPRPSSSPSGAHPPPSPSPIKGSSTPGNNNVNNKGNDGSSNNHNKDNGSGSNNKVTPASNKEDDSGSKGGNSGNNGGDSPESIIQGLIDVKSDCGPTGATKQITSKSGPNGAIDWLNCGVNDNGWNPPFVTVKDLINVDLTEALKQPDSPFHACADFLWAFNQYGNQFGIPPILLASIAMQESTCNPQTVGGAGEQGLMQITPDKCNNAPDGNCKDVNYNVMTGAKYFADTLALNNGNVLVTVGQYNGWAPGMTYGDATAMRWSCCRCQNNLDYLHQVFNGWIQNYDAYTHGLGIYFNLNVCG